MAYCNKTTAVIDYIKNWSEPQAPVKAVTCAYTSDPGAGMGLEMFSLFVFGAIGLGITIRTRHPAPLLVTAILTASVITLSAPGDGVQILGLTLFFGLTALWFYLYSRANNELR